jgi:hypothetical protein
MSGAQSSSISRERPRCANSCTSHRRLWKASRLNCQSRSAGEASRCRLPFSEPLSAGRVSDRQARHIFAQVGHEDASPSSGAIGMWPARTCHLRRAGRYPRLRHGPQAMNRTWSRADRSRTAQFQESGRAQRCGRNGRGLGGERDEDPLPPL